MTAVPLPDPRLGRPASRPLPAPARGCDCRRCPWYAGTQTHPADPAIQVAPLCSGRNSDCSYCGCSRAERAPAPDRPSPCGSCSIRCGSRVDIQAWMADVGGTLEFTDITFPGSAPLPPLPRFIPQVDGSGTAALHAAARWPAYAVGLRRVLSPTTHRLYPRFTDGRTAAEVLELPTEGTTSPAVVLVGYGEDPLVEALWTRRRADRILTRIAALRFDLVLAPNYSLYGNYPRAEMLLNLRRNLIIAAELHAHGVPAVPNLYGFRVEDYDRYLTWLDGLGTDRPPAVAMNLQTFRTDSDWDDMALPALTYLAATLPTDLPVILTGPSRPDRVTTLHALFGTRLHLISQNPLQYATHGALMTDTGRMDIKAHRNDLFARNTRYLADLLAPPPPTCPSGSHASADASLGQQGAGVDGGGGGVRCGGSLPGRKQNGSG